MTPDDMEAVVSARLVEADAYGGTTPFRYTFFRVDVIRALLLDYQERGRALERIFDLGSDGEHSGDRHARCRAIARATLKGKSHD
jgi:hypothetical protein